MAQVIKDRILLMNKLIIRITLYKGNQLGNAIGCLVLNQSFEYEPNHKVIFFSFFLNVLVFEYRHDFSTYFFGPEKNLLNSGANLTHTEPEQRLLIAHSNYSQTKKQGEKFLTDFRVNTGELLLDAV